MKQFERKIILFDFFAINIAWIIYYLLRIESHIIDYSVKPDLLSPMMIMYLFWMSVFMFFGLYRSWYSKSRTDEFAAVFRAISIGCMLLFFLIFFDDERATIYSPNRSIILMYWGLMVLFVGGGRIVVRSFRKRLLLQGIGLRDTIIVGTGLKAVELFDSVKKYPALGYNVIGFVGTEGNVKASGELPAKYWGSVTEIPKMLKQSTIQNILLALDDHQKEVVLDVVSYTTGYDVSIKIIPDMYDIISGQARTNQIYGFPLIEIMPHIMQPWEESAKRIVDIVVSIFILTISAPLWIFVAVAIKLNSAGPMVYSQERVGKGEKVFRMHKFRSMYVDAEARTGPVWATANDPRVTSVGRFLRKTRLDEIPQFMDVLRGDMSLVGPRPERPHFVESLSKEIPLYKRRLAVKPGITGWAQIKQGYDTSIEDVKSKVRYDLFYIENMSFRMDIKILLLTFYTMIAGKGN
ncbi:MAG: sugar transferase [Bacteroidota bacterium]|jgi:exopolysaccharide biosynthesis polyprenyl glycosylphosphotransferase